MPFQTFPSCIEQRLPACAATAHNCSLQLRHSIVLSCQVRCQAGLYEALCRLVRDKVLEQSRAALADGLSVSKLIGASSSMITKSTCIFRWHLAVLLITTCCSQGSARPVWQPRRPLSRCCTTLNSLLAHRRRQNAHRSM